MTRTHKELCDLMQRAERNSLVEVSPEEINMLRDKPPEIDPNPKERFGNAKASLSCVPAPVLLELGVAMSEGALKYGRHNYRESQIKSSTYYDAVMRHMMSWWEGEDIDPESGLSHITKAIASLVVLRDSMMYGKTIDDRPPAHDPSWISELNKTNQEMRERVCENKQINAKQDDTQLELFNLDTTV